MEDAFKPFGQSMELKSRVLGWLWQDDAAANLVLPDACDPTAGGTRGTPPVQAAARRRWALPLPAFLLARRCP
ncbi:MAG TPA: hypothetical protein VFN42_00775 [Acetobacteraceae bacterium]|nr:hypothetical protein [Acetobacteraceae bacterium]